ncbi:PQQ-dependent sugar dehydrogenase [Steroidobacter cummioxidans]|uniref:PQQ-dependent sugar dehydrogenase n=1 Tax=Steroidobacter cummioxidans TaxID=1803913 RepID=UPI000E31AE42|nr:PQQ-dependent sugar dehydrogenase [Steroidobacter cummioxidans]
MKRVTVTIAMTLTCCVTLANEAPYNIEVVAAGLEHPWTVAFLSDRQMLVTERPGRLRLIDERGLNETPIAGMPPVFASGQGGLFDVLPSQDYESSQLIYISFAHGNKDANHTRVVRARFDGKQLHDVTPIFTSQPAKSGDAHFGGRMAWMSDGTLVLGLGDGFYFREEAQKLDTHLAKIVRINPDGTVPQDNPFVGRDDALPEIYSYGHRHVQAIVADHSAGVLYAHEHGPRGGDELNVIEPGRNYGWPLISYGLDYSRAAITPFKELPGMEQPRTYWVPSIAPAGMTLYGGDQFPQWQGNLFIAALAEKSVRRVVLGSDGEPVQQEVLFKAVGQRMRDVRTAPDGSLLLVTDERDGQVLRVTAGAT